MKFRTEVKIPVETGLIKYTDSILSVGSCFADNIGGQLHYRKFRTVINPFGILFNPHSIEKNIRNALSHNINENMIVERDSYFFHYDFHSNFLGQEKAGLMKRIDQLQTDFVAKLQSSNRLIITFGTAWVYRFTETNEIVANCHKVPQKAFTKELLDLEELKKSYLTLIEDLRKESPTLEIILTVSPVRHIKNGLHENNLSKSILLLLTQFLSSKFNFVRYFPAYELVMDDLRDYRFYTSDMIHPNKQAIDYVYDRFESTYFTDNTKEIAKREMKLNLLGAHLPMLPSPETNNKKRAKEKIIREEIAALKAKL